VTFNAVGVASGFRITLVDAQTVALTVTAGTPTGTSPNITVSAGSAAGFTFRNASNRNGPVSVSCTGPIAALACTPSSNNCNGNGRFFTANIALVDAHQNVALNAGAVISVSLTQIGGNSLAPAALTIANGQSTSTASLALDMNNGSSSARITATATVGATVVTCRLTTI
jgi:hypothetical protein